MLSPRLDPEVKATPVASGLPASPGAAFGLGVFDVDRAEIQSLIRPRDERVRARRFGHHLDVGDPAGAGFKPAPAGTGISGLTLFREAVRYSAG